jgi:transposase
MLPEQIEGEFKCPKCGLVYNRDLNACINIAHALTMVELGF